METIELYRADKTVLEWSLGSTVIIGAFGCDHACLLLGINMPFCEARGVRVRELGSAHGGPSQESTERFLCCLMESNDVEKHMGAREQRIGLRGRHKPPRPSVMRHACSSICARRRLASLFDGLEKPITSDSNAFPLPTALTVPSLPPVSCLDSYFQLPPHDA